MDFAVEFAGLERLGVALGLLAPVTGFFAPLCLAGGEDPEHAGQETGAVRSDKADSGKHAAHRKELEASRERLRAAYRSGDPAAIKAAREHYQKLRSEGKEREGSAARPR